MSQSEACVSRHHGSWGRPGHGQLTAACHLALRDQQRGAVRSPAAAQPSTCSCSWPAAVWRSWRRCGQVLVLDGAAAAARLLGGLALTEAGLAEAGDTELGGGEDGWRLHQPRPAPPGHAAAPATGTGNTKFAPVCTGAGILSIIGSVLQARFESSEFLKLSLLTEI